MKHVFFKAVLILISTSLKISHLQIFSEHTNNYQIIEVKKVKKRIGNNRRKPFNLCELKIEFYSC